MSGWARPAPPCGSPGPARRGAWRRRSPPAPPAARQVVQAGGGGRWGSPSTALWMARACSWRGLAAAWSPALEQRRQVVRDWQRWRGGTRPAPPCGSPGPAGRGVWRRRSPPAPPASAARLFRLSAVSGWHRPAPPCGSPGPARRGAWRRRSPPALQQPRQVVQAGGGSGWCSPSAALRIARACSKSGLAAA